MNNGRRYVAVFLGIFGAILLSILALNLMLGQRSLGSPEVTALASEWQEKTHGVTYAPPVTAPRPFKILRLLDRLPGINAMILGSSTGMGILSAMFPAPIVPYNFATVANPTANLIGEADYVVSHFGNQVKWLFVTLDWSIGFVYRSEPPHAVSLTRDAAIGRRSLPDVPLLARLQDALSLPKVKALGAAIKAVVRASNPISAFRQTFFQPASDDYRCSDGTPAKDFDVIHRGRCVGYRYDGSHTFGDEDHLTPGKAAILARAAAAPSSKFTQFLCETEGKPNPEYLARLAASARRFAALGGRMIFLLPPLIPEMEKELLKVSHARTCLERTKSSLADWARQNDLVVIDAGQSERYGCAPGEFLDEHHAFPECHARVFSKFWRDREAGRAGPGLYRPE